MVKPHVAAVALLLFGAEAHAQSSQPPAPPYACTAPTHRALDFWLGDWDAFVTGTETLAGRSEIRSEDSGCVVTERWTSARGGFSGRSLNAFDPVAGRWVQVWMDSAGEVTRFEGGRVEAAMVLIAPDDAAPGRPGPETLRMTLTPAADGTVRQQGEASRDGGRTWVPRYDFTYRRREGSAPITNR